MRLVLDTDVIRSGLQSAVGASRLLLLAIEDRVFVPLVSVPVLLEYEDVLTRPDALEAIGLTIGEVGRFLDGFVALAEPVAITVRSRPSIRDPSDEMFVELLWNGRGDHIVTFNRRDYLPADDRAASRGEPAVPVSSPGETLRRLGWRPTGTTLSAFRRR
jgi:putative PIN family toxin of toxin-antitoxin system